MRERGRTKAQVPGGRAEEEKISGTFRAEYRARHGAPSQDPDITT